MSGYYITQQYLKLCVKARIKQPFSKIPLCCIKMIVLVQIVMLSNLVKIKGQYKCVLLKNLALIRNSTILTYCL